MSDQVSAWHTAFADSATMDRTFDTRSRAFPLDAIDPLDSDAPFLQQQLSSFDNRPLVHRSAVDPALMVNYWDNILNDQHHTSLPALLTWDYSHTSPTPVPPRHANLASNLSASNIAGGQSNDETKNYPTQ
jgi:hypothetical protein